MESAFGIAALWLLLAVVASLLAHHVKLSMSLTETLIGVAAGFLADRDRDARLPAPTRPAG